MQAASAGLGVALSPLVLAMDDLERRSLVGQLGFDADGSDHGLAWQQKAELVGAELELAKWL